MCVHVAVDLSTIFLSRCMKCSVPCGLMNQLAAGWSCYWLQSEMWSDLRSLLPQPLGYCAAWQHPEGRNLVSPFPFTGHTSHIAESSVVSSPRWFFQLCRGGRCRCQGGDNLQGRLCRPHPTFPILSSTALPDSPGWETALCGILEIKVILLGLEEKQEEIAENMRPCPEGACVQGAALRLRAAVPPFRGSHMLALVPMAIWNLFSNTNWKPEYH